jgi:hypothetical protein
MRLGASFLRRLPSHHHPRQTVLAGFLSQRKAPAEQTAKLTATLASVDQRPQGPLAYGA